MTNPDSNEALAGEQNYVVDGESFNAIYADVVASLRQNTKSPHEGIAVLMVTLEMLKEQYGLPWSVALKHAHVLPACGEMN